MKVHENYRKFQWTKINKTKCYIPVKCNNNTGLGRKKQRWSIFESGYKVLTLSNTYHGTPILSTKKQDTGHWSGILQTAAFLY